MPSAAESVGVLPLGLMLFSEVASAFTWVGKFWSGTAGVDLATHSSPPMLKYWSATPMPADDPAVKKPLSALIARHHLELTAGGVPMCAVAGTLELRLVHAAGVVEDDVHVERRGLRARSHAGAAVADSAAVLGPSVVVEDDVRQRSVARAAPADTEGAARAVGTARAGRAAGTVLPPIAPALPPTPPLAELPPTPAFPDAPPSAPTPPTSPAPAAPPAGDPSFESEQPA